MKKVILDENLPRALARALSGHRAATVRDVHLDGVRNGALLYEIEARGFESFVTGDKNMRHQTRLAGRPFSVILLSVTNWNAIRPHLPKISDAIEASQPGKITEVECGRFIPTKFRKPFGPTG